MFYELGLAHAIGRPVVLISETKIDVPFDLRHVKVLLYDKNDPTWGDNLKVDLTKALRETLSNPVEAVPPMFRKSVPSQAPEDSETSLRLQALDSRVRSLEMNRPHRGSLIRGTLTTVPKEKVGPTAWEAFLGGGKDLSAEGGSLI